MSDVPSLFNERSVTLALLFLVLVCTAPCGAREVGPLKDAEVAIKAKRYAEAVKTLEPLAHDGNPRAEWMLGDLYDKGEGVPRDFKKAKDLWEKATAAGDRDAMFSLAGILSAGLGGPIDSKRALALANKSASLGCSKAQHCLALTYLWGWESIKQDYSRALSYFQSAEKSGNYNGNPECLLGFMYENGVGVSKDPQRAAALMKSAKLHGCADGECDIGRTYARGLAGMPKDYGKAFFWLSKAVGDGNARAMSDLGWMYVDGHGVRADNKKAVQLFLKAEKNGYPFAKYNLAEMYRTGAGFPKDLKKAQGLFEESANFGDKSSMAKLMTMGFESMRRGASKQNYALAFECFQSGAKNGDGNGECWLAHLYENGWGVSKDPQRGRTRALGSSASVTLPIIICEHLFKTSDWNRF
jgi:TPR repeat protein